MSTNQVQITGDSFAIGGGTSIPLGALMQIEARPAENLARSLAIFALCCLAPIAAMVAGRQIMEIPLCIAVTAALGAGPFIGIALSWLWKKPWGVVAEFPTEYRTLYRGPRGEAEAIVDRLRGAIAH